MHNGSKIADEVKNGDDWLQQNISKYAEWAKTNDSLLIVTWDEDSDKSFHSKCPVVTTPPDKNRIATIFVGQRVKTGATSDVRYTHQDLLRTILDMYGITPFAGAATAKDIDDIWN
jgi:acid phosphatase